MRQDLLQLAAPYSPFLSAGRHFEAADDALQALCLARRAVLPQLPRDEGDEDGVKADTPTGMD